MRTFDQFDTKPQNCSPERDSQAPVGTEADARHELVYDLRLDGESSERFYTDVAEFSARVVAEIENRAAAGLGGYSQYVTRVLREAPRSRGEYGLELLTVGMAIRLYGEVAAATPRWAMDLARELFGLRRRSPRMKPVADFLRAGLFQLFMRKKMLRARTPLSRSQARTQTSYQGLPRLVEWLHATGEFEQEWRRVDNWRRYWAE